MLTLIFLKLFNDFITWNLDDDLGYLGCAGVCGLQGLLLHCCQARGLAAQVKNWNEHCHNWTLLDSKVAENHE